jgi:type VI secretion system protein ImpI
MALRFSIENETSLPDGGPLSVTVSGKRGLDIGRDQHLDWTLPDPTRTVSGKHCEVRFHEGAYWLHDVSTNGTFLNGSDRRVQGPHRLQNGDRLEIGHYIIAVSMDGEEAAAASARAEPAAPSLGSSEFWSPLGEAAAPVPRRDLQPARETRPVRPDFLDWAVDAPPSAREDRPPPADPQPIPDMDWARGPAPVPAPVEAVPPVPTPRRPSAPGRPSENPWGESAASGHDAPAFPPRPEPAAPLPAPPARPDAAATLPTESAPTAPVPAPSGAGDHEILRRFASGAGIPEEVIAWRDPSEFAELLGGLMRLVAEDLKQLLASRAESKRIARSTHQTVVQAVDNNPLKFSPTPEDALRLMFGRPTSGYLDARRTFEQSFKDLKVHQVKTYAAMQNALRLLVEDLDPQAIEEATAADKGLGALVGSRKARMWDTYAARWQAKTAPHDDGLIDAFMLYFAECYDRTGRKPK